VPDPTGSAFGEYHRTGNACAKGEGSRIEGIGRPQVEASFIRTLVDRMLEVTDVDSVAAMRALSGLLGRKVGPSTGTNFIGMLTLAQEMRQAGEQGSILSLLCDAGERYLGNYHCATWVSENFGDCTPSEQWVRHAMVAGQTC
jgi:cysteine synthase A